MKKYKTIGILGGMGPEATAELYLRITKIFQQKFKAINDDDFPEMIIVNLPIPDVVKSNESESQVKEMLINASRKIKEYGADFIVIPCNTVHNYVKEIQSKVSIKIIDIVQETAKVTNRNIKIGLLATESTIKNKLYENACKKEMILLDENGRKQTTEIIVDILAGNKSAETSKKLESLIKQLKEKGAEEIILGCTELPLINVKIKGIINTIEVLAKATVREAVHVESKSNAR